MTASWDQQQFLSSLGPMHAMSTVFLDAFLESMQNQRQNLVLALQQGDVNSITRCAHSIKGSAGQVRCPMLVQYALQLERSVEIGSPTTCALIETLMQQMQLECQVISQFILEQRS